jgi:hypothetical protein
MRREDGVFKKSVFPKKCNKRIKTVGELLGSIFYLEAWHSSKIP